MHLGMLLIIIFFYLGHIYSFHTTVYNRIGAVLPIPHTDMLLSFDDFSITTDPETGAVTEYLTAVRVFDGTGGKVAEGDIRVNHPLIFDGYQFSQSSFGYVVRATVNRGEEEIGSAALFQDEVVSADSGKFIIELVNLIPDFVDLGDRVASKSQEMNNPYAYIKVYYMESLVSSGYIKMGDPIEVGEYTAVLDRPEYYSLLDIRKDPYMGGAGLGAVLLVIGLMMTFLSAEPQPEEGEDGKVEDDE